MNPKVWDLYIEDCPRLRKVDSVDHVKRIRSKGYDVVICSTKLFDSIRNDLRMLGIFANAGLFDWGIRNVYRPKDSMRHIVEHRMSATLGSRLGSFSTLPILSTNNPNQVPDEHVKKGQVMYG